MRILVTTHYWRPHVGGIETVAREQAVRLRRRGHEVTVLTSRLSGNPAVLDDEGVMVRRVGAINPLEPHAVPFPLFSPGLLPAMHRELARHDVVLAHGHVYLPTLAAAMTTFRRHPPLVLLQHSPRIAYGLPWRYAQSAADATIGRFCFGRASVVAAVSEYTAAYVRSITSRRPVEILRSGVDVERFVPSMGAHDRTQLRARFGWREDEFVALSVRRLTFRNGVDTLVAAAEHLRSEPIRLVIAGEGEQRPELERSIATKGLSNVTFLGRVADDVLADLYRAADVFVLPTRTGEGFGLVLLEAAASGLPVVATRAGAQAEVVEEGETGLLIDPESPYELAKAITGLAEDRAMTAAMGEEARMLAVSQSWDRSVSRLEDVLSATLGAA